MYKNILDSLKEITRMLMRGIGARNFECNISGKWKYPGIRFPCLSGKINTHVSERLKNRVICANANERNS